MNDGEIVKGSIQEIINHLIQESRNDEEKQKFIAAIMKIMGDNGITINDEQMAAYTKIGDEYIMAIPFERDIALYISYRNEKATDLLIDVPVIKAIF